MSKLTLRKVKVVLGKKRAPTGTHVYLDVPGGDSPTEFDFQHFVVKRGRLHAQDGTSLAKLDVTVCYWCLWSSKSDGPLTMRKKKDWGTIEPFGFPLPARIRGRRLILPNTKTLTLRVFDMASGKDQKIAHINESHVSARLFYKQLHIDLAIDPQERPKAWRKNWPILEAR
ncbi:MAG: hypothetical protein IID33_03755, partial [Planctomycetes bacterium]|nr:hypothetical protein [Planctomycetota bacterium]